MALVSINPANKQLITRHKEISNSQIDSKLAKAQDAYAGWRQLTQSERARHMKKVAKTLKADKFRLAKLATAEMGKAITAAEAEVEKCAHVCDYYAENSAKFLQPEAIKADGRQSYAQFDPLGVILAVMPWNFPYWQVFRFAAPALMAGNVGVLKHASNVQQCAEAIEQIFAAAGLPKGVFQNLAIGSAKVEPVIRDPRIKAVTLTGSEYAGSEVAKTAGEEIKKTVLELGGSDPFIVLEDADIDQAAKTAVSTRLQFNAGQSCISAKRFIVHHKIADEFTQKVKENLEKLAVGDPMDSKTDVGPMSGEQALLDIERQVKESVSMGAKVISGGRRGPDQGYYYLPTLLTNVTQSMPAFSQETFGPIMPIVTFNSDGEALRIANDNRYGLASSIFSADVERAKKLAADIDSGAVFINGQVKSDPRLPFGGVKKSGYGRELSHYGIKEFVNIKTVWVK